VTQLPDISTFAEFVDAIHGYRERTESIVRGALVRIGDHQPPRVCQELADVSRELEGTFRTLDDAAEELRAQNEALFAARVELEGASALFRDLFELAPTSYIVTNSETCIVYANDAACALLRVPKNALVGKPLTCFIALEERSAFRAGVTRACESGDVSTWPTVLAPRNGPSCVDCRLRVRSASTPGAQIPRLLYWNITEETDEDLL
jgi:PAS domain S-box-containing protein